VTQSTAKAAATPKAPIAKPSQLPRQPLQ
jgi:hypothetical protein